MQVESGSVGIVANQTGVYPLDSPGGWQIIGKTPIRLFDGSDPRSLRLQAGDHVEFYEVSRQQYEECDDTIASVLQPVSQDA